MANVLIIGCGGIGCELALTLKEQGHHVYGLRRDISEIPEGIEPIEADLSHTSLPFPENLDYVFYTASAGKHKDVAYYQAYVSGVKHSLHNLEGQNLKRLFFISSSSVFGQNEGEWVTEESPVSGNNFSTKRLLEGEELINQSPFPSTIVRFGGIYGPGRTHLIDLVQQGKAHCMEDVYSNRIHSADCVGMLSHLMNLDMQSPEKVDSLYIGVDDQPTPSCEVYEWLAEQLNAGYIEHLEPTENSRLMRSNKRLSNAKIRATGYNFQYPSYQDGYIELI
ncbi:NAD-dependent epimerase/dehydratase family protein [Thiomicrorhabdus sp. zzn3]|uniref:NAD-dependent epimerase/dehydratase family protein n=1 Tax=Thiomicrorhabdus sp. zzn3 TaxID=3039775 RepID=UPI0024372664|nr:NAD-dependent epimerase/dehydratase family protein [Thiomicrorhabdus sp. zzn3]MDG6779059.1 NAD-dependent epimerase/dehydratase family protein [Thiomicrorhabdus sp. zzn3]